VKDKATNKIDATHFLWLMGSLYFSNGYKTKKGIKNQLK
jgi:hypothetical protein